MFKKMKKNGNKIIAMVLVVATVFGTVSSAIISML